MNFEFRVFIRCICTSFACDENQNILFMESELAWHGFFAFDVAGVAYKYIPTNTNSDSSDIPTTR